MLARKSLAVALICLLALGMAACTRAGTGGRSSAPTDSRGAASLDDNPNTAGAGAEIPEAPSRADDAPLDATSQAQPFVDGIRKEFSDENVTVELWLNRESYTVNDVIDMQVTVFNNAATPIAYAVGSGSNRVPDALNMTLGKLTSLHTPVIATKDMRYDTLPAGGSVTFALPYAPFTANAGDLPGPGLDQTLDWFTGNADYTAAAAGPQEGSFTFTYQLMETDSSEGPFNELMEGGNPKVITGTFSTELIEAR